MRRSYGGWGGASCGPSWTVVRQAAPNPFLGKTNFAVDAIHYDNLMIGKKSEAEYLGGKDPQQQASFVGDKQARL